jgi:hypothetical protein
MYLVSRVARPFLIPVLLLLAGPFAQAGPVSVVAPNANASVEGNSNNGFPFNLSMFSISSMRYQQVYDSSQFGAFGGPMEITAIVFRPDGSFGSAFASTLSDVRIDLSTTSKSSATITNTFASNVGGDDTIVYGGASGSSLSLSSSDTGGPPRNFDITINLTTPFLYDPANGNLLLDVRNFGGGRTTQFDSVFGAVGTSRVFTEDTNGVNDTTGGSDSPDFGGGLVTEFIASPPTTATPEPASLTLMLVGVGGLLGARLARRRPAPASRPAECPPPHA